jgi:iron complex outermembrane receptor protein
MFKRTRVCQGVMLALGGAILFTGLPVSAEESAQRIEVTGSRIKRTEAETASPIQVVTRDDIEKSGKSNISDVIRGLSGDNNGSISTGFENGFAAGASGVSLRGLGVNSTLVLVNGRRMAPYGLADDGQRNFVDLSAIPLDAVDRVEVLKDGASALYGSDAIAGVVNIILRKDYQGFIVDASAGQSRYGDGQTKRAALTAGFGSMVDDKFNVLLNFEVNKQDEIWQGDRKDRKWIGTGDLRAYGYDFTDGWIGGWFQQTPDGVAPLVSSSPYGAVRDPVTLQYTSLSSCTSTISLPEGFAGCPYDIVQKYFQIQPKEDKYSLFLRGTVDVSPEVQPYVEVGFHNSKVETSFTPASASSTWADVQGLTVKSNTRIALPGSHPDNPLGVTGRLRYLFADVGPRSEEFDTKVTRLLVGSKGVLGEWDYDAGLLYAQSKTDRTSHGYIRDSVFKDFLNATNNTGLNPDFEYYRFGANSGLNSAAMMSALSPTLKNTSTTSITSVDLKASRDLVKLPGGMMALAVGAEVRKEKLDSPPTPYTDTADIIGLGYASFKGSRTVSALYSELVMPVLKSLEFSAAVRNDHYSDYGNSFTPKLGMKWTPMKELVIRSTFAQGFRAPGTAENGNSSVGAFTTYVDPVRCPVTDASADCGGGQLVVITAGNPDVKPERSKSFTLGLVFEPVRDFSASVDLWQITRKDEITGADPFVILDNPAAYPGAQVIRDDNNLDGIPNSGTILAVSAPYVNSSKTKVNGVDIDLRYKFNLFSLGRLTTNLTGTRLGTYERTQPDGTVSNYVGTHGPTSLSGNAGMPRIRYSLGAGWEYGSVNLNANLNFIGGMKNVESNGGECLNAYADGSNAPTGCKIPSFTTVDLTGKYAVTKDFSIYGGIQNLFDKIAPLDPQTYGGTNFNPTYHMSGAVGRFFSVGARYAFK